MNERELLLKKISEQQFATHEVALFLDTHPDNRDALKAFDEYQENTAQLRKEYNEKFGMLTHHCPNRGTTWNWVKSPWPWD